MDGSPHLNCPAALYANAVKMCNIENDTEPLEILNIVMDWTCPLRGVGRIIFQRRGEQKYGRNKRWRRERDAEDVDRWRTGWRNSLLPPIIRPGGANNGLMDKLENAYESCLARFNTQCIVEFLKHSYLHCYPSFWLHYASCPSVCLSVTRWTM